MQAQETNQIMDAKPRRVSFAPDDDGLKQLHVFSRSGSSHGDTCDVSPSFRSPPPVDLCADPPSTIQPSAQPVQQAAVLPSASTLARYKFSAPSMKHKPAAVERQNPGPQAAGQGAAAPRISLPPQGVERQNPGPQAAGQRAAAPRISLPPQVVEEQTIAISMDITNNHLAEQENTVNCSVMLPALSTLYDEALDPRSLAHAPSPTVALPSNQRQESPRTERRISVGFDSNQRASYGRESYARQSYGRESFVTWKSSRSSSGQTEHLEAIGPQYEVEVTQLGPRPPPGGEFAYSRTPEGGGQEASHLEAKDNCWGERTGRYYSAYWNKKSAAEPLTDGASVKGDEIENVPPYQEHNAPRCTSLSASRPGPLQTQTTRDHPLQGDEQSFPDKTSRRASLPAETSSKLVAKQSFPKPGRYSWTPGSPKAAVRPALKKRSTIPTAPLDGPTTVSNSQVDHENRSVPLTAASPSLTEAGEPHTALASHTADPIAPRTAVLLASIPSSLMEEDERQAEAEPADKVDETDQVPLKRARTLAGLEDETGSEAAADQISMKVADPHHAGGALPRISEEPSGYRGFEGSEAVQATSRAEASAWQIPGVEGETVQMRPDDLTRSHSGQATTESPAGSQTDKKAAWKAKGMKLHQEYSMLHFKNQPSTTPQLPDNLPTSDPSSPGEGDAVQNDDWFNDVPLHAAPATHLQTKPVPVQAALTAEKHSGNPLSKDDAAPALHADHHVLAPDAIPEEQSHQAASAQQAGQHMPASSAVLPQHTPLAVRPLEAASGQHADRHVPTSSAVLPQHTPLAVRPLEAASGQHADRQVPASSAVLPQHTPLTVRALQAASAQHADRQVPASSAVLSKHTPLAVRVPDGTSARDAVHAVAIGTQLPSSSHLSHKTSNMAAMMDSDEELDLGRTPKKKEKLTFQDYLKFLDVSVDDEENIRRGTTGMRGWDRDRAQVDASFLHQMVVYAPEYIAIEKMNEELAQEDQEAQPALQETIQRWEMNPPPINKRILAALNAGDEEAAAASREELQEVVQQTQQYKKMCWRKKKLKLNQDIIALAKEHSEKYIATMKQAREKFAATHQEIKERLQQAAVADAKAEQQKERETTRTEVHEDAKAIEEEKEKIQKLKKRSEELYLKKAQQEVQQQQMREQEGAKEVEAKKFMEHFDVAFRTAPLMRGWRTDWTQWGPRRFVTLKMRDDGHFLVGLQFYSIGDNKMVKGTVSALPVEGPKHEPLFLQIWPILAAKAPELNFDIPMSDLDAELSRVEIVVLRYSSLLNDADGMNDTWLPCCFKSPRLEEDEDGRKEVVLHLAEPQLFMIAVEIRLDFESLINGMPLVRGETCKAQLTHSVHYKLDMEEVYASLLQPQPGERWLHRMIYSFLRRNVAYDPAENEGKTFKNGIWVDGFVLIICAARILKVQADKLAW